MKVWHVNTTLRGGGVAEILEALLNTDGEGYYTLQRFITDASPLVFGITKRLHHRLHGYDRGGLPTPAERVAYLDFAAWNTQHLLTEAEPGDLVVLHDPQTAPMAPLLARAGLRVVWRCHIGTATSNAISRSTWQFLSQFWAEDPVLVFSDPAQVPSVAAGHRVVIIPPSIDPHATKNLPMTGREIEEILARAGLRSLGTDPVVLQVSRWDPLKDMPGVLRAFAGSELPGMAQLVLCGPSPESIADDPEAAGVLAEVVRCRESLPGPVRKRVHLVCPALEDREGNARLVGALQRRATVVVQKSLEEGFGLTVTEAMWKARPVVASGVGGIRSQITHGLDGLLLEDPRDHAGFAELVGAVLDDPDLAVRIGSAAQLRVAERFTIAREAEDHQRLYRSLAGSHPTA